jgi:hypothetical protein
MSKNISNHKKFPSYSLIVHKRLLFNLIYFTLIIIFRFKTHFNKKSLFLCLFILPFCLFHSSNLYFSCQISLSFSFLLLLCCFIFCCSVFNFISSSKFSLHSDIHFLYFHFFYSLIFFPFPKNIFYI